VFLPDHRTAHTRGGTDLGKGIHLSHQLENLPYRKGIAEHAHRLNRHERASRKAGCSVERLVKVVLTSHSGNRRDAPAWIKRSGFQWALRLCQEPGRLWKRYLVNNSTFMVNIALQLAGIREYKLGLTASETQGEV
jgi:hypothetical protein